MTDRAAPSTTTSAPSLIGRLKRFGTLRASGLIWVLLLMVIVAAIYKPTFINPSNLVSVARQTALFGIVAIGMTMVILTAGIDARKLRAAVAAALRELGEPAGP